MHISDLRIDRFGIWRDLTLPLAGPGLNVLYGPNEAGKSTLMRFLRSALYGGVPPRPDAEGLRLEGEGDAAGSVRLVRGDRFYDVSRVLTAEGGGRVELTGPDGEPLPPESLDELLGGTSEAVFDRVFAVDLYELQELATLDHEDLADHIYGLSLGPRGLRLLAAVDDLRRRRQTILSDDGRSGRLVRLLDRERALLDRMRTLPDVPAAHARATAERDAVDGEIAAWKRRRTELQHELRGRRYLSRVWSPWKQARDYRAELAKLPPCADLPPDGLEQIDALEAEIGKVTGRRDARRAEAEDRKQRLDAAGPEPEIARYEPAVRAMLGMRDWLRETDTARQAAAAEMARLADGSTKPSGRTSAAAAASDPTLAPEASSALFESARSVRDAVARRAVVRRQYRRLQKSVTKQEASLQERDAAFGDPARAAAAAKRRLAEAEKLTELRAREAALDQRNREGRARSEQLARLLEVPPWVSVVLALFAVGGAVFAVMGLVSGVTTNVVAGTAYLLLGLTCGSLAVKLRSHFESGLRETVERARDERRSDEVELRKVRDEIGRLAGPPEPTAGDARPHPSVIPLPAARSVAASPAETIRRELERLAALDALAHDQEEFKRRRRFMTELRSRLRRVQQGVDAARHEWCQTLGRLDLGETLDAEAAFAEWRQRAEAAFAAGEGTGTAAARAAAEREHAVLGRTLSAFGAQIETLARRLGVTDGGRDRPLDALAALERQLDAALVKVKERRRIADEYKKARREAAEADEKLRELGRQRTTLFAAAGVKSRADYERRLEAAEHRRELEELLDLAEAELEEAAAAEPELAIVEEDLRAFRPEENGETLKRLAGEQETLEAKLESAYERRGQLNRRIEELEADESGRALRRERARLDDLLRRTAERLLAASLAERAAEQARQAYERDHQPPVLGAASESLARLTRNRYRNVWVPLGRRELRVDDDQGRTFSVEQLSGGTREQLFLALRLGLVREAEGRGVRLPLILDDVFVNFDQLRTEAAFETLRDFADEGRQVLFFTCHLHLAHLAESRGVDPIWLPGHQPPMQQRLAG